MCSLGLGAKRRAKPPGQKRDIRPPQKLLRVGTSLLPFTSISTTTDPPAVPSATPQGSQNGSRQKLSCIPISSATHVPSSQSFTDVTTGIVSHSSTHGISATPTTTLPVTHAADHTASNSLPVDPLTNLYTIANACMSTDAKLDTTTSSSTQSYTNTDMNIASEVMISDNSGLQIFTTINEPYEPDEGGSHVRNDCSTLLSDNSEATSGSSDEEEDQCVLHQSSSADMMADVSSEASIYQLLFQLPSVSNTSLCSAVVCAESVVCCVTTFETFMPNQKVSSYRYKMTQDSQMCCRFIKSCIVLLQ